MTIELKKFDQFVPNDDQQHKFYNTVQQEWITTGRIFLGTDLRRCPTQKELFSDFMNNHNGQRYRAYFTMKYPERMRSK